MAGGSSLDSDALVDGWPGFWRDLQLDRIKSLRVTIPSHETLPAQYTSTLPLLPTASTAAEQPVSVVKPAGKDTLKFTSQVTSKTSEYS